MHGNRPTFPNSHNAIFHLSIVILGNFFGSANMNTLFSVWAWFGCTLCFSTLSDTVTTKQKLLYRSLILMIVKHDESFIYINSCCSKDIIIRNRFTVVFLSYHCKIQCIIQSTTIWEVLIEIFFLFCRGIDTWNIHQTISLRWYAADTMISTILCELL